MEPVTSFEIREERCGLPRNEAVIKNAVILTVTHGNLKNGSVYIKDGKIAAVGESVNAPSTARVIDAGGKYLGFFPPGTSAELMIDVIRPQLALLAHRQAQLP